MESVSLVKNIVPLIKFQSTGIFQILVENYAPLSKPIKGMPSVDEYYIAGFMFPISGPSKLSLL